MATAQLLYVLLMVALSLVAFEVAANPVPQNDCTFDESAAAESNRSCGNKKCSLQKSCNGNRQCVCDGVCGYRCININNPRLCQPLPAPVNGSVVYTTKRAHGAKATYKCSPGYSLVNTSERTCLGDGEWSMDAIPTCLPSGEVCPRLVNDSIAGNGSGCLPACNRKKDCPNKAQQICVCRDACGMSCVDVFVPGYCPDIELTEGTIILSVTPRDNMYTSVATISCEDGYEMDTETQEISCLITGQWSAQPASCTIIVICSPPPRVENARHNSRSPTFSPGDKLIYTCNAGYRHYGSAQISTCLHNEQWTPVVMKCYALSCGDPGFLTNGWRDGELFTFLSRVIYHCNEGYEMRGYPYRTCLSDRRWSSFLPSCEAVECPALFAPDHGTVQGSQYEYSEQVYFACKDGYRLEGSTVRRCQADRTWSGNEVICTVVRCPEPEKPENGYKIAPRLGFNALVRYFCNDGHSLFGSRTSRCTMEETWSNPVPECKAECIVLDAPQNGVYGWSRVIPGQAVTHGTVIQIYCYTRYSLNSNEEYMCDDGQWSFHAVCEADPCSRLDDPHNGVVSYEPEVNLSVLMIPHGTRASYSCLHGYEKKGGSVTVSCSYGRWSQHTPPVCQPKPCDNESLQHGRVIYDSGENPHHGTVRIFECSEGYSLDENLDQSCNDGFWTSPLPNCQPDPCQDFSIADGTFRNSSMGVNHGQTADVICNTGLKPSVGDGQIHCHAGHWVPDPKCIPKDASFNIAYGKPAVQSESSVRGITGNASLAVDGDRYSDFNHGSCTHVGMAGNELFWQVDLQGIYIIESVDIYKEQDCCGGRLSEASIHVGLTERATSRQCGPLKISEETASQQPIQVDCASKDLYGQYITIRLPSTREAQMTLCEVEVFGFGPVQTCKVYDVSNLTVYLSKNTDLSVGTIVAASVKVHHNCTEGYTLHGSPFNKCNNRGEWRYATPTCEPDGCDVNAPEHGQLNQREISKLEHSRSVGYSCESKYIKLHDEVVCQAGHFKPGPPSCVPKSCHLDASQLTNVLSINNQEPSLDSPVIIDHNDQVTFSCKNGFYATNSNTQTQCLLGELQGPIPICNAVQCPRPPSIEHGSYRIVTGNSNLTHKTLLNYQCDEGYRFQTGDTIVYLRCGINGNWGRDLPSCQLEAVADEDEVVVQECTRPSIQRALIYHQDQNIALPGFEIIFVDGDVITIRCTSGFRVNGQASATCRQGKWEPTLPSCEVSYRRSCERPERLANIAQYRNGLDKIENIDSSITTFTNGGTLISRCRNPLANKLVTSATRTCYDGQWQGEEPRCETAITQFQLLNLENMRYQYYANSTLLIYPGIGHLIVGCRASKGYVPNLNVPHGEPITSKTVHGNDYGAPSEAHSGVYGCRVLGTAVMHSLDIQVRAVSCPEPPLFWNGRRLGDDFTITNSVSFECNDGYQLQGDSTFKCNLGQWSPSFFPSCRSLNCPEIRTDDPQITVEGGGTSVGSTVAFSCNRGYRLVGDDNLICQSGGTWSNSIPSCEERADLTVTEHAVLDCGGECEIWERCTFTDHGQLECNCINPSQCEEGEGGPYCGSDGRNYASICHLKAADCLLDKDIEVDYQGPCRQDTAEPVISGFSSDWTETLTSSSSRTSTWVEPTTMDNNGVFNTTSSHQPGAAFSKGTTTVTDNFANTTERADLSVTEHAVLNCGSDCEIWERCTVTDHGQFECNCIHPSQCEEEEGGPYCGTDGNQYTSICHLKAVGCLLDKDIEVEYHVPCRQG